MTTHAYDGASELIASLFHEAYERLAPEHGYGTRNESAVPWESVPVENRKLMTAVVRELLGRHVIRVPYPGGSLLDGRGYGQITDMEAATLRRLQALAQHEATSMRAAEALRIAEWIGITIEDGWLPVAVSDD